MIDSRYTGIIQAILGSTFFGLNSFFFLPLYQQGFSIEAALSFRFIFTSIPLLAILLYKKQSLCILPKEILHLALIGFIFFISSQLLYNAIASMPSGIATTIFFTTPIYVMIMAVLFLKEKIEFYKLFFSLLACLGIAILSGFFDDMTQINIAGLTFALLGAIGYATYILSLQKLQNKNINTLVLLFYVLTFCGVYTLFYAVLNGKFMLPTSFFQWSYLFGSGFLTGAMASILLVVAIKKIGSVLASIFGAMEPITTVIIGVLIFGEPMNLSIFMGIIIVLFSVVLLSVYPALRACSRGGRFLFFGQKVD